MLRIEYQTQRLSLRFFLLMLVLFFFQTGFGLLLAAQHIDPDLLAGTLNFNVVRAEHTNLGILWVLSGFIGTILFVGPLLSKRELAAPPLIKFLFWALLAIVVWNVFTQTLAARGVAGWWAGQPWLHEGLEYIEAGRLADVVILIGFSILCYVVLRTFPAVRDWNEIHWGLGIGVVALTVVWIAGMFFVARIDVQEYFRWYVVHYWVEGVWEVIHISLVGFLLVLMFKADVKSVGYAVFWGISLVWLSGLIGNAHHYFWIGTPEFWQFWGSLFSALEPLPLIFCFWHIYLDSHANDRPLVNAPAFYFLLGSATLELVGAGILGFVMTFALTNVWSHGTWVTAGHGHLALFGTFGMLGIGSAYWAIPAVRKFAHFDQKLGKLGFWLLFVGILGVALSFAWGGTIQIYVYRILGLDWFGGDVFPAMNIYKVLLPTFGFLFMVGALVVIYDLITLGRRAGDENFTAADVVAEPAAPATGWSRPLTGFEAGIWLLFMWIFGMLVTFGLLSFNLDRVRIDGDPTLPYLLSGVGNLGLLLVTFGFVWRFTASLTSRILRAHSHPLPEPDLSAT